MEERCVYVKVGVLSALERETRGLKWQLARTAKIAEARAADVVASECKVKDLLTIVEMNKNVADRAVRRTYTQESQLQRLTLEHDECQRRLLVQRRRFIDQVCSGLQRRRERRLKRVTLRALAAQMGRKRRLRVVLSRLTEVLNQMRLSPAFERWRASCQHPGSVLILPVARPRVTFAASAIAESTATTTKAFLARTSRQSEADEFLFDECFRLRFKRRLELKRLSFFVWKAEWGLAKNHEKVAVHHYHKSLSGSVLRGWRRHVTFNKRCCGLISLALDRRRRQTFRAWATVSRCIATRHKLLVQILRSLRRRLLQRFLTRLRLQCLERATREWADVLKTAHVALEEEKLMNSLHQDAALKEIHASYAAQEQSRVRCLELQSHQLFQSKRFEVTRHHFATWRLRMTRLRLHDRIAAQFHRVQQPTRLRRRHFVAWKRVAAARARIRRCLAASDIKKQQTLIQSVFSVLIALVNHERAKRRRLRALLSRIRRVNLQRSWSQWRYRILIDEQQVTNEYETHSIVQSMQREQLRWQSEFARAEKLRERMQLECALLMRDAHHHQFLRRRFHQWAIGSRAAKLKRRALRKVLTKLGTRYLRRGFVNWRQGSLRLALMSQQMANRAGHQTRQRLTAVFQRWRSSVNKQALLRWNSQRQCLYFALWRGVQTQKRAHAVAFCCFLRRKVVFGWQFQAFTKWRRRHLIACKGEQRRESRARELLEGSWRRWSRYVRHRLRLRNRQHELIGTRMFSQQALRAKKTVFASWKTVLQSAQRHDRVFGSAIATREAQRPRLRVSLVHWRHFAKFVVQRRLVLARSLRRLGMKVVRIHWQRWFLITMQASAALALRQRALTKLDSVMSRVTSRHTMKTILSAWRASMRQLRASRLGRERFRARQRMKMLRQRFGSWKRGFQSLCQAKRRVLLRRVTQIRRTALTLAFQQWERCIRDQTLYIQATVSHILLEKSQERAGALMQTLLATRSTKFVFSAWMRFTLDRQAMRRGLERIVRAKFVRLQYSVWTKWNRLTDIFRKLDRLSSVVERLVIRAAWQLMYRNFRSLRQRTDAANIIIKIASRTRLRFEWNTWKRKDRFMAVDRVAKSQQSSLKLVHTAMESFVSRRHARSAQSYCFLRWRQQVAKKKRIRGFLSQLAGNRDELSLRPCFQTWIRFTDQQAEQKSLLRRILGRQMHAARRSMFHRWKYECLKALYKAQLTRAQQQLNIHRMQSASHVAMAMYIAWKRPCLSSCFASWRVSIQNQKHERDIKVTRVLNIIRARTMAKLLHAWNEFARMKKTAALLWKNAVLGNGRKLVCTIFHTWKTNFEIKRKLIFALGKMVGIVRFSLLRHGFKLLCVSLQENRRHESMLVVLSAQQALQRQKQQHLMKNVAFLLQRKQISSLKSLFSRWKYVCDAKKQVHTFLHVTKARFQLKMLRCVFAGWRSCVKHQVTIEKLVRKLQTTWGRRHLHSSWADWCAFTRRSQKIKWCVYHHVFEKRVQLESAGAWETWRYFVKHANLEIERRRVAAWTEATEQQLHEIESLESSNECLLLESITLKRQVLELRRRNLGMFSSRLVAVLAASGGSSARKLIRAFAAWRRRSRAISLFSSLLKELRHRWSANGFSRWCCATNHLRVSHELVNRKNAALEKVLLVFSCSNAQMKKRKALLLWKVMAARQRIKKKSAMLLLMVTRSSDRVVVRCCWASWKVLVSRKHESVRKAQVMHRRTSLRLVQSMYLGWCRWHSALREVHTGLRLLIHVLNGHQRRRLIRNWLRWRSQSMDAVVTLVHAKLAILQLEHWNSSCQHTLDQLLVRVFTNWKGFVFTAQARRLDHAIVVNKLHLSRLVRLYFVNWRSLLPARQRVLHPVLCIQTSLRRKASSRVLYCGYNEYRHKRQSSWRLTSTKHALRKRLARLCALSILLGSLRHQHHRVLRRAFWSWFAKAQCISRALQVIQFKSLPWRMPRTNFAGSMLLLALEEMHHLQQASRIESQAQRLRTLALIFQSFRRQHLRRGFDRMKRRLGVFSLAKRRSAVVVTLDCHKIDKSLAAAIAQGFAEKLKAVIIRRSFRIWKEQYVALALLQAEAAQMELLHALRDVSSYRQTLDPYAVPY